VYPFEQGEIVCSMCPNTTVDAYSEILGTLLAGAALTLIEENMGPLELVAEAPPLHCVCI